MFKKNERSQDNKCSIGLVQLEALPDIQLKKMSHPLIKTMQIHAKDGIINLAESDRYFKFLLKKLECIRSNTVILSGHHFGCFGPESNLLRYEELAQVLAKSATETLDISNNQWNNACLPNANFQEFIKEILINNPTLTIQINKTEPLEKNKQAAFDKGCEEAKEVRAAYNAQTAVSI